MSEPENDLFTEGLDAYRSGLLPLNCPYEEGSGDREEWFTGWHAAEARERA